MNTMPVYAFADAQGLRTYVDSDDFVFTGTWSSAGTYVADPFQAAQYGSMLYMCVTDNINKNPATVPTRFRPTRYWSPMVIVVSAGTTPADSAYQIATEAYALAVIGTNLGSLAYTLAETGSNLAWESFLLAQTGTAVAETALEAANGAFSVATDAYLLAEAGTNAGAAGTMAYTIAGEAYALAVAGTNAGAVGTMAYTIAGEAYALAVSGTNAGAAGTMAYTIAGEAYALAVAGTNAGAAGVMAYTIAGEAYALAVSGTNQVLAVGTIATAGSIIAVAGSIVAYDAYLRATLQGPGLCDGWVFSEAQGGCVGQDDVFSCDGQTVTLALVGCDQGASYLLDITERKQFGPFAEDKIVAVTGQVVLRRPPGPSSCVVTGNYTNMTIGPDGPEPSSFWALPVLIAGTFPISFTSGFLREGVPLELVFHATGNDGAHLASPTATIAVSVAFSSAATQTAYNAASVAAEAYLLAESGTLAALNAATVAGEAYVLAEAGTNTGIAATSVAGEAYVLASAGTDAATNAAAQADVAFDIAVVGTNAAYAANGAAGQAYALAQIGTNTGTAAYNLATTGSNLAYAAYVMAQAGTQTPNFSAGGTMTGNLVVPNVTVGVGSYSYYSASFTGTVGTLAYSFAGPAYQRTTVNGAFAISTSSHRAGAEIAVILIPDGTIHTLAYTGSAVTWFGTTPPVQIYDKAITVAMTCITDSPVTVYGATSTQV